MTDLSRDIGELDGRTSAIEGRLERIEGKLDKLVTEMAGMSGGIRECL